MKKYMVLFVVLVGLMTGGVSRAMVARELTYADQVVWRCVVRLIRVDNGFAIVEQDKDTGYLLFEYNDGAIKAMGSVELFTVNRMGRQMVRVQINVQGQPRYVESLLQKKLERKLKNEYGEPPQPRDLTPLPPVDNQSLDDGDDGAAGESDADSSDDAGNADNAGYDN